MTIHRQLYYVPDLSVSSSKAVPVLEASPGNDVMHALRVLNTRPNCVGSKLADSDLHAPALDIDLPCQLIPSSTPGHFHLYIDKPMPWRQYAKLLAVLAEVGILEDNYVAASLRDGATILRRPGVRKGDTDA